MPGVSSTISRVVFAARRKAAQNARQFVRVVMNGQDFVGLERVGEGARHHQAVFQHVGNAAGRAHIVFEHAELARFRIAHQIDAADMRVNSARHFQADHFAPEMRAGIDERARNLPVLEDALLAVNVLQEQIQRHHALRQAALDALPFRVRKDAGNQVERETAARCRGRRCRP